MLFRDDYKDTNDLVEFKKTFDQTYPGILSVHFDSFESLKKNFLEAWNRYQERELDNKYPIIFKGNHAYLIGERLI